MSLPKHRSGTEPGAVHLTDVLQSCVSQDPTLVLARKTIDGQRDREVKLLFEQEIATFAGGEWTGCRPQALVYDTAFVTRNVYAGDFVDTQHRANLLDFALGSAAVEAREKERAASEKQRSEAANQRLLEARLKALAGKGVSLSDFRALPEDPEIEDKIARAKKDVLAAQRFQQILGQAVPVPHQLPELGVEAILKTLETTLEGTHREAEEKVRAHASSLGAAGASRLREGTALAKSDDCPFCGQDVVGVDLVAMYRLVFNEAYERLERDVRSASLASARLSGDALINEFRSRAERNAEVLSQWREHVEVLGPGDDGECLLSELFTELFQEVSAAVDKKEKRISTNPLTGEQHERILQLTEKVEQVYRSHNEQISEALQSVSEFQGSVGRSDAKAEQQKLRNLELVKLRHEESAEAVVQELVECEAREVEARAEKDKARDELSDLMNLVLGKFQGGVNEYLERFNASFRINKLNHSYRGKVPRAEYEIVLRDAELGFGGGYPSFAKGLSDGDKKTLGFAFFAASTLADPELGGKIVVFDDPVSSLDRPRRAATIATLAEIAERSAQLIVLAHDAYFLRELRTKLRKSGAGQVSELAVREVRNGHPDIVPEDLDELCESR